MSFQACLTNIQAKTRKSPEDFRQWSLERGFATGEGVAEGAKVGAVVGALESEFGLGHGHAMAIMALLKGKMS